MSVVGAKPFVAVVVLQAASARSDWRQLWLAILADVQADASDRGATLTLKEDKDFSAIVAGAVGVVHHYAEARRVAWMPASAGLVDSLNHVLAILVKGSYAFVHASDTVLKARVEGLADSGAMKEWKRVPQGVLVHAFVASSPLKALWLRGAHRPVTVKASSKVLAGADLRDAVDPLGDTTFSAGAVRSTVAGVSLRKSGIWQSRAADWTEFDKKVGDLATKIDAARAHIAANPAYQPAVHPALSIPVESLNGVKDAFHVQWADPETAESDADAASLVAIDTAYKIDLVAAAPGAAPSTARVSLQDQTGAQVVVDLVPKLDEGRVKFTAVTPAGAVHHAAKAIERDASLVNIYYDSGHSIVGGVLSRGNVTDRPCDCLEFFDFGSFTPATPASPAVPWNIGEEKPAGWPTTTANLFSPTDRSLFVWVYRNLAALGLPQPNGTDCWLYSDDGSMEVADFVLVQAGAAVATPRITLIHVKPCSTAPGRRVCTGPYEVVVAQALKNLRAIDANDLIKRIQTRAEAAFNKGEGRLWGSAWAPAVPALSPTPPFFAALRGIGTRCDYSVLIVQPHVKETTYNTSKNSTGAVQLRALLFSASAAARSVMAKIRVIGST